jgi:hypothetical protein
MNKRNAGSLFVFAMLIGLMFPLYASQTAGHADPVRLRAVDHYQIKSAGQVIYEKDVDSLDPALAQLTVALSVDDIAVQQSATADVVKSDRNGTDDGHDHLLSGYMISYVVTDVTADGHARLVLAYTIVNPEQHISKNGHISEMIKLGEPHSATTQDGTKIVVTVSRSRA